MVQSPHMTTSSSSQPFLIGVAGGSGSGKSTVVKNLMNVLGPEQAVCIAHDHYYRDQSHLPMAERLKVNYDHPSSLETELLIQHVQDLRAGKTIDRPVYDFAEYTRSPQTVKVQPAPVIIVEGILIFESKLLRQLLDLKVFVDTDNDIRFIRRLQRDIAERGRTADSVIEQYLGTVRPMYLEFVEPNKRYADVIIPEGGENKVALELLLARVREIVQT
jgi:uridine kinase